VRRVAVLLVIGLALGASSAVAQPVTAERCRTESILRFEGDLYFQHRLRAPRPALRRFQGVALERACDDAYEPGEPPEPWLPVRVFALDGIRTAAALAPGRRQVIFYSPYLCSPRLSETRFLRCLRRR
jgi:hypothetical protein